MYASNLHPIRYVLTTGLGGCIHLFFEGYFAVNHTRMGPAQDLFGQLWKEYSLSDSRYLRSDAFLVWMESITAFAWGPLSFALVYFIMAERPYRHITQALVSMGQIYGDVLYYATSLHELYANGVEFCRPEGYYFWGYYVFFNAIWILVPSGEFVSLTREIADKIQSCWHTACRPSRRSSASMQQVHRGPLSK